MGFPFVIIYFNSIPLDLFIEPEYISAILTASSILFGLYVIVGGTDETKLKSSDGYTIQKRVMVERLFFLVNLMVFLIAVLFLFCSIVGIMPTLFTLCVLVSSFITTCMLLIFQLLRKIPLFF